MGARVSKEVSFAVGIVVERRPATSRWIDWIWRPVAALEGIPRAEPYTLLSEEPDGTATFYAGSEMVALHPREADAYRLNLAGENVLYVILRPADGEPLPYSLYAVAASPYDAEAHLDSGEEIVEPVPMPRSVREVVHAFCLAHPKKEVFRKRRRDTTEVEKLQFGKEPIFKRGRHVPAEGSGNDGK